MNPTIETYTTDVPANVSVGNLLLPFNIYSEFEDTSSAGAWVSLWIEYPRPMVPTYSETYREDFIGILSEEEAREIKKGISLFKKRFDEDLTKRQKILFGK